MTQVRIDIKAFENMVQKYNQLLYLHEIPEEYRGEFLEEAKNVLQQFHRVIDRHKAFVIKKEKEDAQRGYKKFDS